MPTSTLTNHQDSTVGVNLNPTIGNFVENPRWLPLLLAAAAPIEVSLAAADRSWQQQNTTQCDKGPIFCVLRWRFSRNPSPQLLRGAYQQTLRWPRLHQMAYKCTWRIVGSMSPVSLPSGWATLSNNPKGVSACTLQARCQMSKLTQRLGNLNICQADWKSTCAVSGSCGEIPK